MVQKILSAMDSDQVNSVNDTVEAGQVLDVIEETFYEMLGRREWKFLEKTRQLESVSDTSKPNVLKVPYYVSKVEEFRYKITDSDDTREKWRTIKKLDPVDFLEKVQARDSSASNILEVENYDSVPMYILNDAAPSYWTTFDDEYIWTDSYDASVDDTLQQSKSAIRCLEEAQFSGGDTTIQSIPAAAFNYLLEEAKSTCFVNLKQVSNVKAEAAARRLWIRLREQHDRVNNKREYVNYGR